MEAKAADHPRIWLAEVEVSQTDPDRLVKAWLDEHSAVVWAQSYGYNALYLYDATGAAPEAAADYTPQYPLAADLGGGRCAAGIGGEHVVPGEAMHWSPCGTRRRRSPSGWSCAPPPGDDRAAWVSVEAPSAGPWRQR